MTAGVATPRPPLLSPGARSWLAPSGLVLAAVAMAPPLATWARHYEYVEALQFSLFAMVVPALLTMGAPWRALRLARGAEGDAPRPLDRVADGRRRHPELLRAFAPWLVFVGAVIAWRTPAAVDGVTRHVGLLVAEALSFAVVGVALWLELVESEPLSPRSPRPRRLALGALSMWAVWVMAYTEAMSSRSWYTTFAHRAGQGLSASADHQVSTIVIWSVAAACFMPGIFWNLYFWLRNDEDPDDELHRLLKEERRRAWQVPKTLGGDPPRPEAPPA